MRTRSSSNLVGESSHNSTSSNPKRRNRRRSKQPFILEESPVDTMADQRTMAELLRAPTEGYAEAIVVPPILAEHFELKHSLINMMTSDQFFELENDNPHDHIPAVNYNQGNSGYRPPGVANQIRSLGPLPSNIIANPKGKLKAITTRSGLVLDEPSVPMPPPFINLKEDERVDETLTDPKLGDFTIKVPPPLVQKAKPPSQRNYVVHQRDPRHPNIPYPLRMHKEKQQENDEVQIHKFWQMFKQLHINITLVDALILILKYHKMLKALLSNKEKLLELANTPLNENCSAVILKKLPEKLGDPGKFLISCGFSELKCKALADLGKHQRASFKTKRSFSINKLLHLLHMDLFGPVKPQTISHNKYTLVIVDEYSRNGYAVSSLMDTAYKMKNLKEVRVKELRSNNGTEFRNYKLEEIYDENGISYNFSSPCTPEQNGVAEKRNKTLTEAARTMLNSAKLPKQF
uniref:Retrovirus-related Pol polyprotein from transposon TNT 1-94 n=1 Tax=Tanacetum cinerariifolium TaxID=118510 RepID=A0A6L2JPQ6_TANCI|nr:retrovirus-related Pol polyprotein from transposon TNT 1-94 [Tanacetum cinerariifolium]